MSLSASQRRPDGTIFPPVTPDPPFPPGYEEPVIPEPSVADDEQHKGDGPEPPD